MIFDRSLLMSNAQAITATAASTDVIDLGATGTVFGNSAALVRDVGRGYEIPLRVQVVQAFNNLTSLTVAVQCDDNSGFSSARTVATSQAVALASLAVGYVFEEIPTFQVGTNERYVRLNYTVAGTAPTTGQITAGITLANQRSLI
jgi:hypothetical protein